jgi:hypothetical protein
MCYTLLHFWHYNHFGGEFSWVARFTGFTIHLSLPDSRTLSLGFMMPVRLNQVLPLLSGSSINSGVGLLRIPRYERSKYERDRKI